MTTTLALPETVRSVGGLLPQSAGGATDGQINAAIAIAQSHLTQLVKKSVYITVSEFDSGSTGEELEKKAAFTDAEAKFAVSFLPTVLSNAQLQETGYKLEASIGKATTKFANSDDISIIADFWASEAMIVIVPYTSHSYYDQVMDEEFGYESDDGSLTLLSI